MLLSSCLLFYMCCFLIRLFAVWRYAGRIFNAGICRGKAISEFRSPKALPLHPHPLGHGSNSSLLCVLRCWLLSVCCGTQNGTLCRSVPCILRYLWRYAMPICDLVLGFFGTYSGTLCRSAPCILRYLWWYAEPGCCGGGVITTWAAGDGVIAAGPAFWAEGEFCTWRSLRSLSQRWPSSAAKIPGYAGLSPT